MSDDALDSKYTARASADLFMPESVREVLDTSFFSVLGADVNVWSALHAASGWTLGKGGIDFGASLALHEMWEQWQSIVGSTPSTRAGMVDRILDTSFYVVGWVVGRNL